MNSVVRGHCIAKGVQCRTLRGLAVRGVLHHKDGKLYMKEEDLHAGLEVAHDKPKNEPQPPSTRSVFMKRKMARPTFRYPIVALDPKFAPPPRFQHFKPPADYFPGTPEEAGLPMRRYLDHRDMWTRKQKLDIPYFCAGCYMAVTVADRNHPQGEYRFVGLCLHVYAKNFGANFYVANVIEGMPTLKQFMLYAPYTKKIEVLKAERRNQPNLLFLFKEKHPQHYTVPEDMQDENPPDYDKYSTNVPLADYVHYLEKPDFFVG